ITGKTSLDFSLGTEGVDILAGSSGNMIGGVSARDANGNLSGFGNLISGNRGDGIFIGYFSGANFTETGNVIDGNYIGTDVTGTKALANGGAGVQLDSGGS